MPAAIRTITEARFELAKIRSSVDAVQAFMDNLDILLDQFASVRDSVIAPVNGTKMSAVAPADADGNGLSLADQVLLICKESPRALKPKTVVAELKRRGFVYSGKTDLYNAVFNSLSYLTKRKGVLEHTKKHGYVLKKENLPEISNEQKAKEVART